MLEGCTLKAFQIPISFVLNFKTSGHVEILPFKLPPRKMLSQYFFQLYVFFLFGACLVCEQNVYCKLGLKQYVLM